jgi:hypothetical protein
LDLINFNGPAFGSYKIRYESDTLIPLPAILPILPLELEKKEVKLERITTIYILIYGCLYMRYTSTTRVFLNITLEDAIQNNHL